MKKHNRWLSLVIILIGFFMILLDTTVVNVSIPTIIRDLHANLSQVEWIVSGYALSFAALLITFGRLGDLYGRRLLFMLGLVTFTIASFFSGEATTATTLILARIFQGVGGAMISPAVLSIISSTFRDRERALAFGIFGAITGIAVAIGPILGGWLTTYYTWRWIFRINIPIGIIGLLLAAIFVPESRAEKGDKVDIAGMVSSSIGFFFLIFGLIEGQTYGWWKPLQAFSLGAFHWGTNKPFSVIVLSFILSLLFLVIFTIVQVIKTHRKTSPAVNIDFFHSKAFRYGLVTIAILALGEFSSLFALPIFLQSIRGFTPLQSGYATLPMALSVMIGAPISAAIVAKIGSKRVITTGIFLEAIGLFLMSRLNGNTHYVSLIPALVLLGFGLGLAIAQNTQVILSEINPHHAGSASGVLNTVRQVGTALGIAVVGAVLAHQATLTIPKYINEANLPGIPQSVKTEIATQAGAESVAAVSSSGTSSQSSNSFNPTPPAAVANNPVLKAQFDAQVKTDQTNLTHAVGDGLAEAISDSMKVATIFLVLGAFCSLLIPNIPAIVKKEELVG